MAKSKLPPTPWKADGEYIRDESGAIVASVYRTSENPRSPAQDRKIARVMAAAPDLHRSVRNLLDALMHGDDGYLADRIESVTAALRKAGTL